MATTLKSPKVEISPKSVVIALLIIIGFIVAWELRPVFFLFFIAYIINAAFRPAVNWLEARKVPRLLSIFLLYLLVFGILGLFVATIFTQALAQLNNLISQVPNLVFNILTNLNNTLPQQFAFLDPDLVKENLREIVSSFLRIDPAFFSTSINSALGVISYAATASFLSGMIFIISVYLLARKEDVSAIFVRYLSGPAQEKYSKLFERIERKLGMWLRAQITMMFTVAMVIWIGLTLPVFFVPGYTLHSYALPIAMLVFLIEIVPGTGIALGGILSTLIALASGNLFPIIYTPLLFILTQQLASMLIIPRLMKRAVGLDPVVTILSVLSGYLLFGPLGAILIIPILAVVQIVLESKQEDINKTLGKIT